MLFINVHGSNEFLSSLHTLDNLLKVAAVANIIYRSSELFNLLSIGNDLIEMVGMVNSMAINWADKMLQLLSMLDDILNYTICINQI